MMAVGPYGELIVQASYLAASALFILALMWMSSPKTATATPSAVNSARLPDDQYPDIAGDSAHDRARQEIQRHGAGCELRAHQ